MHFYKKKEEKVRKKFTNKLDKIIPEKLKRYFFKENFNNNHTIQKRLIK